MSDDAPPLDAKAEGVAADQVDPSAQFEVTLILPTQTFAPVGQTSSSPRRPTPDGCLELNIPVSASDAVQELRGLITESPDGFWLGAFGFVPVVAEELLEEVKEGEATRYGPWVPLPEPAADPKATVDDPKPWKLNNEGVLGEFCEISAVFGSDAAGYEHKKRGLKVVPTSFSPLATSLHLLRFRDTVYGNLPNLSVNATYDPSAIAISAGVSLYSSVRGVEPEPEGQPPLTSWSVKDLTPFTFLNKLQPAAASALASACVKSLGVSAWSPPPHARRMRGDIAYLTLTTLEGQTFQITCAASGFWVSKSSATTFDPAPKTPTPRGVRSTPYHSLFELCCALSSSFSAALVKIIESQNLSGSSPTDLYASLAISHAIPAASWVVPAPVHLADPFRTQLAYLLTGSTTADLLPAARDWNDELGQCRELPQSTMAERLLRERLLHRVQCDFAAAATRGALSIARGDVPPLNPNEVAEAHTFILNNMLFTRADGAVSAFAHLGGSNAARVAAAKDLAGVTLLEQLDVKGLRTMATVLVDFLGERWVVQSLIPGLFKTKDEEDAAKLADKGEVTVYPEGDQEAAKAAKKVLDDDKPFPNMGTPNRDDYPSTGPFRIVYGSADPEEPDKKVRASAYFGALAKQVAERLHFAEHTVETLNGEVTKLWTSTDMHGIAAPDGRSYFIDCFRLHCVDVEFLENDIAGPVSSDSSDSHVNGVHTPPSYPHRLPLLRSELLETYRESKLEKWIEDRVAEARISRDEEEKAAASVESELKEAAADASTPPEPKAKSAPAVIRASDFKLTFNPDAFVERKTSEDGAPSKTIYDPKAESTAAVRDASLFLRSKVLPDFVTMVVSSGISITDGHFLSRLMHRKGINMRYLGALAAIADRQRAALDDTPSAAKMETEFGLNLFKKTVQHAIIVRTSKHILNRLLRSSIPLDHAAVIAHFFNCLVGTSLNTDPSPELVDLPAGAVGDREWTTLTPSSLRQQVIEEGEARFRYSVPASFFNPEQLVPAKLVREVCLRVGIQLVLREYHFGPPSAANGNGHSTSTDDEKVECSAPCDVPAGIKKKKKKAASKEVSTKVDESTTVTFHAEDVLNVMPMVKATTHKSRLAEETFAAGAQAFEKGNFELGQEIIQDALNFYEQIFGSVHPEASSQFHTLGIMYHSVAQAALRKISAHEAAEEQLNNAQPENRAELTQRFEKFILENVETQRAEAEQFLLSAVRMLRQGAVVAERTFGLDSAEAIQQYSDLGLVEQSIGNTAAAIRLTRHALALWNAAYGPNHPTALSLLSNIASMAQNQLPLIETVPLLVQCREMAQAVYGPTSVHVAAVEYQLAQVYGLTGNLAQSIAHITEAVRLYQPLLGPDAKETKEAEQFQAFLTEAMGREGREEAERDARLRKKFPRLMADKSLRAKMGAVSSHRSLAPAAAVIEEAPDATQKEQKPRKDMSSLSVDKLVSFIQGTPVVPSTRTRKRKGSPPTAKST